MIVFLHSPNQDKKHAPLFLQVTGFPFSSGRQTRTKITFWCFIPFNNFFIDQTWSVKMAGYWPSSFLRVYGPARLRLGP